MITHEERLRHCLAGEKVDRAPVALWRHFPIEDDSPGNLASAVVRFQETYDFDLVKITPASSFSVKGWGAVDQWKGNPEGSKEFVEFPVKNAGDWSKIHPLSSSKGSLAAQLECINMVKKGLPAGTPIIQTIFSPLSQAKNLVGRNQLPIHLRLYPDELKAALRAITETTLEFVKIVAKQGIAGIFYAVQHAQVSILSPAEFDEFAMPYDLEILEQVKGLWLNFAHLHGTDVYFDKVSKYPVNVLNWHDLETPPDLETGKKEFKGAVCGGLKQWETLVNGSPEQVESEARSAIRKTNSNRFILGTGCVLPITTPHSNILAARKAVEQV